MELVYFWNLFKLLRRSGSQTRRRGGRGGAEEVTRWPMRLLMLLMGLTVLLMGFAPDGNRGLAWRRTQYAILTVALKNSEYAQ